MDVPAFSLFTSALSVSIFDVNLVIFQIWMQYVCAFCCIVVFYMETEVKCKSDGDFFEMSVLCEDCKRFTVLWKWCHFWGTSGTKHNCKMMDPPPDPCHWLSWQTGAMYALQLAKLSYLTICAESTLHLYLWELMAQKWLTWTITQVWFFFFLLWKYDHFFSVNL